MTEFSKLLNIPYDISFESFLLSQQEIVKKLKANGGVFNLYIPKGFSAFGLAFKSPCFEGDIGILDDNFFEQWGEVLYSGNFEKGFNDQDRIIRAYVKSPISKQHDSTLFYYSIGNCLDSFLKRILEFYEILDEDQEILSEFFKKYEDIRSNELIASLTQEEIVYILDLVNRMVLIKKENQLVCYLDKLKSQVVSKCKKENSLISFFIFIKSFYLAENKNSYVAHSILLDL